MRPAGYGTRMDDSHSLAERRARDPRSACSVVVIDPDDGARRQVELAACAADDLRFAGSAETAVAGAELVEHEQPDIVVLQLDLADIDGLDLVPLIRRLAPSSRIHVRTHSVDRLRIAGAIEAGAAGYLQQALATEDLQQVLEAAARDIHRLRRLGDESWLKRRRGAPVRTPGARRAGDPTRRMASRHGR